MNCRSVLLELSSYLDGDLDVTVLAELEVHLKRCEDCRIIVDTTRKTIEIYCKAEAIPLPDDVRIRLHENIFRRLGHKPTP
jgi:predicted anti-sigma-YlaC factor YlaD